MSRTLLIALALPLLGASGLPATASPGPASSGPSASPWAAAGDEELEAVARKLRIANAAGNSEKRRTALDELVALGDADGIEVLQGEFSSSSRRMRDARQRVLEKGYVLEHKIRSLETMKVRAESNPRFGKEIAALQKEIEDLGEEIDKSAVTVRIEESCCADLEDAAGRLFSVFGAHKRRKLEEAIWDAAEDKEADPVDRMGAVEMLGRLGGPGTSVRLQKVMARVEADRVKLKRQLPKLESEVREMEQRIQEEQERLGGQYSQATADQYNKVRLGALQVRRALHLLGHVSDACVESGGQALAREGSEMVEKSLKDLIKAQRKGKDGVRMRTLEMLSLGGSERVL